MAINMEPRDVNGVPYLTLRQASFEFDLNEQWLRRMCRETLIPFIRDTESPRKPILLAVSDLQAYVASKGQRSAGAGSPYQGLPSYVQKAKSVRSAVSKMDIADTDLDEEDRETAVAWLEVYTKQQIARGVAAKAAKEAEAAAETGTPPTVDEEGFEEEWEAELEAEGGE